jgi:hypothetical protein
MRVTGSCSMRRPRGMRGGQRQRATMAGEVADRRGWGEWWRLLQFPAAVLRSPDADKKVKGCGWCSSLPREREGRGEKRGERRWVVPFLT